MCLSLMRTVAGVIKYAVSNVLNRLQTYSNSIDCTITTVWYFFFTMLRVRVFFMPFSGCANFLFLQILPLPPPPPPPHEINWSVPYFERRDLLVSMKLNLHFSKFSQLFYSMWLVYFVKCFLRSMTLKLKTIAHFGITLHCRQTKASSRGQVLKNTTNVWKGST